MLDGQIVKSTGGLYQVETTDGTFSCRPRGIFRKTKFAPLVGDFVKIELDKNNDGTITEISPRKNSLIRPPIANIDKMVLVVSTTDPAPNFVVIDKFIATMEFHGIGSAIAITKTDLKPCDKIQSVYSMAGYKTYPINNNTGNGIEPLAKDLSGFLVSFAGNTGTGKSSLLNSLDPTLSLQTGETSKKLGRGRHTTRHVEIFRLQNGLRIADTPGFSSMDIIATTDLLPENLDHCFTDFLPFIGSCKFNNCRHISETGCAVKKAVEDGKINKTRYESYCTIYDEIKDVKVWQRK